MILLIVTSRNTEPLAVANGDHRNHLVSQRQTRFVACRGCLRSLIIRDLFFLEPCFARLEETLVDDKTKQAQYERVRQDLIYQVLTHLNNFRYSDLSVSCADLKRREAPL